MKFRKSVIPTALAMATFAGANAQAQEVDPAWQLSGSVSAATGYLTEEGAMGDTNPVLQGGLNLGHKSGFYGDIWRNQKLKSENPSNETDYRFGYTGKCDDDGQSDVSLGYFDIEGPQDIWNPSVSCESPTGYVGLDAYLTTGGNGYGAKAGRYFETKYGITGAGVLLITGPFELGEAVLAKVSHTIDLPIDGVSVGVNSSLPIFLAKKGDQDELGNFLEPRGTEVLAHINYNF